MFFAILSYHDDMISWLSILYLISEHIFGDISDFDAGVKLYFREQDIFFVV